MKSKIYYMSISLIFTLIAGASAQNDFDVQAYMQFLQDNENLESGVFLSRHQPRTAYYNSISHQPASDQFAYLDSIIMKYELTADELALLRKNHFMVSERLSFDNIINAIDDVFIKELPVFVTSDAILHAMHISYSNLLIHIESNFLQPRVQELVTKLNRAFPQIQQKYAVCSEMDNALKDVDLYLTIARSLMNNQVATPQFTSQADVNTIWQAIQAEKFVSIPLFTTFSRRIDFSQFTVRGYYTRSQPFKNYFKTMMWLAQIEFVLANPPQEWYDCGLTKAGLVRLNIDALLLNELLDLANVRNLLAEIDSILRFMVGESDNLTPAEFSDFVLARNIADATALLDEPIFDAFVDSLAATQAFGQKILSNFMKGTPGTTKPTTLPVSFRLMGQRFIIDSYIFYKVVYDNVVYQNQKICRMLPEPLDAMFALGNNDALHLLKSELETWNYSSQLAALRYLVDSYNNEFWNNALYNIWLNAIRQLNPGDTIAGSPLFMQSTAWHQQKLNTQLCAWTQLRHDNLLYAKQSYTHGGDCFYPHSYVEPYPELYQQIANFGAAAGVYFARFPAEMGSEIVKFFQDVQSIMQTLEEIMRIGQSVSPPAMPHRDRIGSIFIWRTGRATASPKGGNCLAFNILM